MTLTCINCPMGCELTVKTGPDGEVEVEGWLCGRGRAYGKQEATAPERTVTALAPVEGSTRPLPVKTERPIPKARYFDVLAAIRAVRVVPPVAIGDVVLPDVCNTGVSVVATAAHI
ncbi:MAG: DUF1667 domain-containing protein [Kiritimatiellia bacterium]|jgi:CxxC motif-containing protein